MPAVRAWGVVIRERRLFGAGVVGGRICGVVVVEEGRCILAHLTSKRKNEVKWMANLIYCKCDVYKLRPVHVARGNRHKVHT